MTATISPTQMRLDLAGRRVLLVDDVPANLDVLLEALGGEGYGLHIATNGEAALEVAVVSSPDLILLDVMMPGIDGYETCRRLKQIASLADVPVIFLTARDDLEGIVEGFESGGLDYVTKPFKKEEILVRVRTHLERALLYTHLEDLVAERTRQLRLRVKELEGKDRIAECLLSYHGLDETLTRVVEVVTEILDVRQAGLYLTGAEGLRRVALVESAEGRAPVVSTLPIDETLETRALVERACTGAVAQVADPARRAAVPILRDGKVLGVIEVVATEAQTFGDGDLNTLASFALQAAVAIQDAQVRQDPEAWHEQLDEVLELEGELQDVEQFDELNHEMDA